MDSIGGHSKDKMRDFYKVCELVPDYFGYVYFGNLKKIFFKDFIYLFLERGRERIREKNIYV